MAMRRIPLSTKILIYSSALLVALIVAMLVFVNFQAGRYVSEGITSDLNNGRDRAMAAENDRMSDLQLTAELVASFPELKALLSTDLATVRDFLTSYQQNNKRAELLIVLDPAGRVVARTDELQPAPLSADELNWVRPALSGQPAAGILAAQGGIYNAAAVTAEAGGTVFGCVIAAGGIDNSFALSLREITQDEVTLIGDHVLGSTFAESALPPWSRAEWEAKVNGGNGQRIINITGEKFAAQAAPFGPAGEKRLLAVFLKSQDRSLAPFRRIQFGLVVLGFIAALAGISVSVFLARTVTTPLAKLVEGTNMVAAGNFNIRVDLTRNDEISDLAQSFNSMTQGLRERADMQKFISQSTVDMIQASSHKKVSAGERKVMTIFFSDMRAFTAMSERMAPEDVVKILNSCLSLQAEKVKKFGGDIDKYVGDAVVALFSGEDMALNAIRCAVEIHKSLDAYNAAHPDGQSLIIGIGIVTGEVILGSIGSEDRLDFTVIGSNVNLCSRLCSIAGPRETLLAESTYLLVQDLIAAQRLEPLNVKGFSDPVPVYKIASR